MSNSSKNGFSFIEFLKIYKSYILAAVILIPMINIFICSNDPWHVVGEGKNPDFINRWRNIDAGRSLRFTKVDETVFLQGVITGGGKGSTAFILPAGYRPSRFLEVPAGALGEMYCTAAIGQDGRVSLWFPDTADKINLNISFLLK